MDYAKYKDLLEQKLVGVLDNPDISALLRESMSYSLLSGGKRMRGVLLLAGGDLFGVDPEVALTYAAAIEMIHAYSLIHDDLPCMDDDDLRRGQPTSHVRFGEANALLAGDGLLNYAYETLLKRAQNGRDIAAMSYLATGAGVTGMIAGQSLDLLSEGQPLDFETLQTIHRNKTGALIRAAAVIPAILAQAGERETAAMASYGESIGIAFQITDDVLDVIGDVEQIGKTLGKDERSDKLTYVKLFGVEQAKQMAKDKARQAQAALDAVGGDTAFLKEMAEMMVNRIK